MPNLMHFFKFPFIYFSLNDLRMTMGRFYLKLKFICPVSDFGNKVNPSNICIQFVHKLSENNWTTLFTSRRLCFQAFLQYLQLPLRYTVKR